MSELINTSGTVTQIPLAASDNGVGDSACCGYIDRIGAGADDDADRPTIWIELGGQLKPSGRWSEPFAPPLMDARPSIFAPSQKFDRPPIQQSTEHGEISFKPEDSNWIFRSVDSYRPLDEHQACAPADLSDLQNISIEFVLRHRSWCRMREFRRYKSTQQ